MKGLLDYIETHYGEHMGVTFIQYLNDFRLAKAEGFLLETSDSVTVIAQRCGFDNISYFNRLFRQKYRLRPGEFRKNREAAIWRQESPTKEY